MGGGTSCAFPCRTDDIKPILVSTLANLHNRADNTKPLHFFFLTIRIFFNFLHTHSYYV